MADEKAAAIETKKRGHPHVRKFSQYARIGCIR